MNGEIMLKIICLLYPFKINTEALSQIMSEKEKEETIKT